jgi:hypothetical protein
MVFGRYIVTVGVAAGCQCIFENGYIVIFDEIKLLSAIF